MPDQKNESDRVSIGGSVSGQVAFGRDITQTQISSAVEPVSQAELTDLREAIADIKAEVVRQAPPDKQTAAIERLDELHQAITAGKPEVSTMDYVRNWFVKNVPTLAGAVTSIVVNPIVGRLVQAGGDTLVADFKRRFPA